MKTKEMEAASANIATTAKALEAFINKPENYNSFASSLMEQVIKELEQQASAIREIEYMYRF
jgi:seryl-tRNA(Sec) selenium transferase